MSTKEQEDTKLDTVIEQPTEWFKKAIAAPRLSKSVEVEGCKIHYLEWGEANKPGLVMVPGNRAHAHWWAHIAPLLANDYHVIAMDFSGMGDSGWRESYDNDIYAREIMAAAKHAELGAYPMIVGHSLGGMLTLHTAHIFGEQLGGIVVADFAIRTEGEMEKWSKMGSHRKWHTGEQRPTKVYEKFEDALARFRLMPDHHIANKYIKDYIAEHSLREVEGGWTWKFHHKLFHSAPRHEPMDRYLSELQCPIGFIYGDKSDNVGAERARRMAETAPGHAPIVEIPDSHHHLMMDQPLPLVTALRGMLPQLLDQRLSGAFVNPKKAEAAA